MLPQIGTSEEIQRLKQEIYSRDRKHRQEVCELEKKNENLFNCWQQANKNTEEAQRKELLLRRENQDLKQRIRKLEATLEQTLALEPQVKLLQAEVLKLRAHFNPPTYSNVGAVIE